MSLLVGCEGSFECETAGVDLIMAAGLALGEAVFSPVPFSKAAIAAAMPRFAGPLGAVERALGTSDDLSASGGVFGFSELGC